TDLRSFLRDRVDESLTATHERVFRSLLGPRERGGDPGPLAVAAGGAYFEWRAPDGLTLAPTGGQFATARPRLPDRVSGLSSNADESSTFFTVDSAAGGDGPVPLRAERPPGRPGLLVAPPPGGPEPRVP